MFSLLYEKDEISTKKKICVSFFVFFIIVFPFFWLQYFDISYPLSLGGVLFSSTYLFLVLISLFIILRINVCLLILGWFLLIFSFLLDLLCELTKPPDIINVYIKGELKTLALLLVVIGFYITVNKYRQAEKKIKESEEKYRMIFDTSPEAIVLLDKEGNLLTVNKRFQQWLGRSPKKYLGKNLLDFDFLSEKEKKKALDNFTKRVQGKNPGPYELEFLKQDRTRVFGRLSAALIKDKNNNLVADLVMISDVTKQRLAEKQVKSLQELDKAKDEFLNIAAHELKTPLASIMGMTQMLQAEKNSLNKTSKGYLEIIRNESFRLNRVVKQILTVTKFEQGKPQIKKETLDLGEFIKSLKPTLKLLAGRTKSKIKLEATKNVIVNTDKDKVAEIIYNLIENAVKYGRDNQTITIKVSQDSKEAKVEVLDQGEGISKALQKKIFVKFSQLENYLSRSQEGIGLGLYICKVIIRKLGGKIKVKSISGQGSNFYFTLPVKK